MKTIFAYFTMSFLIFSGSNAFSQGYVFRVLANKGQNQVKRAAGTTEGLKTGATLKTGDQLIASSDAYIGLVHNSGKTLEVRQAGVLKVNDLEKKVAAKKTSVTSRYAQYVMNKINDDGVSNNYRRNNNVTGAAKRATGEGVPITIDFVLPIKENKIVAYDDDIVLRWVPSQAEDEEEVTFDGRKFKVVIQDIFDVEIFKAESEKPSVALNLADIKNESTLYLVRITTIEENGADSLNSIEYAIEKFDWEEYADDEETKKLLEEIEAVKAEVDTESSMGRLVLASFYEEKGMLLSAMREFEKLVSENPDILSFQDLYGEFLAKNGMVVGEKKGD